MKLPFVTVDVFTTVRFGGNPLAVVFGGDDLSGEQMQRVAREFNLSETVFVLLARDSGAAARLRIFTPMVELPFAGHPTVGTAAVLAARGAVDLGDPVTDILLEEGVGPVPVRVFCSDGAVESCQLTTAQAPEWGPEPPSIEVLAATLSLEPDAVRNDDLAPVGVSTGIPFLYVPLVDQAAVSRAALDIARWRSDVAGAWAENILLFATEGTDTDVHARMFGPSVGVDEDPATGSAASGLAVVLAKADATSDGTLGWSVAQGVEMGRPSRIEIEADKVDGVVTVARVRGVTVPVSEGEITVG